MIFGASSISTQTYEREKWWDAGLGRFTFADHLNRIVQCLTNETLGGMYDLQIQDSEGNWIPTIRLK